MLRESDMGDVLIIAGGIIPDEDVPLLKESGVRAVFGPGTSTSEIADFITANVRT